MKSERKPVLLTSEMHQILMFLRAEWKLNSFNDVIKRLYEVYEVNEK